MWQNTFYFFGTILFIIMIIQHGAIVYVTVQKARKLIEKNLVTLPLIKDLKKALMEQSMLVVDQDEKARIQKAIAEAVDLPRLERIASNLKAYLENRNKPQEKELANA